MQKRFLLTGAAVLGLLILTMASPVRAQVYNPGALYQRPVVSPYINLLRGGGTPAINYYGIVRPEFEVYRSIRGLQQEAAAEQQAITSQEAYGVQPVTGHVTYFRNYSHYFAGGQNVPIGPRQVSATQRPATTAPPARTR
jgi:hypothetical protein